jgi:hypothetical protein
VPAVDLSLPFAPSWTWCLGGQTVTLAGSADCPLLGLVSGWSVGLHSLGAPSAPSRTWVGRWVGQVTVGGSGEATEGVRHHIEVNWVQEEEEEEEFT